MSSALNDPPAGETGPSLTGEKPDEKPPPKVEITPLGRVDEVAVSVAAANIQAILELNVDVSKAWPRPEYALLPAKRQYNAGALIKSLTPKPEENVIRMGLINEDLCTPVLSYVFGEAQINGRAAVVSLFRLSRDQQSNRGSPALIYERLAKVVLHEMAHVLGLRHCQTPWCLMCFSMGLKQLDDLTMRFCPACEAQVRAKKTSFGVNDHPRPTKAT